MYVPTIALYYVIGLGERAINRKFVKIQQRAFYAVNKGADLGELRSINGLCLPYTTLFVLRFLLHKSILVRV